MFDSSLFEMLLVLVIALIVIGPERLPALARSLGQLVAKCKAFTHSVKSEIERQGQIDELQERRKRAEQAEEARQQQEPECPPKSN